MPVSKRDKKVSLTKTVKKGMKLKHQLVEDIRKSIEIYNNLFVFNVMNMRNRVLKHVREEWKGSRLFFAKRKVMAIALGRTEAEEAQKNLHKLSSQLVGQCGLLFTDTPKDDVIQWFQNYSQLECARAGFEATETVVLPAGPLEDLHGALEPRLRTLGLPTQLEKGTIVLREEHVVCTKGARLTPSQANILKLLKKEMAEFKITLMCVWSKDGSFEKLKIPIELRKPPPSTTGTPKLEIVKTPKHNKQKKETPKQVLEESEEMQPEPTLTVSAKTPKQKIKTPKQTPNTLKLKKTFVPEQVEELEISSEEKSEKPSEDEEEIPILEKISPKVEKKAPRRSMRTPKPTIKRSPEQKKLSVKKLTVSAKKQMTPQKPKGTPKLANAKRVKQLKTHLESEDVEMS